MSWLLDVLDCVPLVGAAKNGIEAIIHCYNGNGDEATSKAVQCVVSGVLDIVTLGAGGTIVKIGGKAVAKVATKVVSKEAGILVTKAVLKAGVNGTGKGIVMVGAAYAKHKCCKGGNKTQTKTNSSSKKDTNKKKKQKKDKKDEDEPQKNPNKDDKKKGGNGNDGSSKNGPKRGHHVINYAVLSIYGDIIEIFLTTQGLSYRDDNNNLPQDIVTYHNSPLPNVGMTQIGYTLVISEEVEGGTNQDTYGKLNKRLIIATVRYMQLLTVREIDPTDYRVGEIDVQRDLVLSQVENMIKENAFVDEAALALLPPNHRQSYNEALEKTAKMLRDLIELAEVWVKLLFTAKDLKKLSGKVTYLESEKSDGVHHEDPGWKNY